MQQYVILGRILEIIDVALNTEKKRKSSWLTETKLLFQNSTITANNILNLCTLKQEEHAKANKVTIWYLFTGVFSESSSETLQDVNQFFLDGTKHQVNASNPSNDETKMLLQSSKLAITKIVE